MRVVIFEDEAIAAQKLRNMLLSLNQEIEILAVLNSVEDGRDFFSKNVEVDLVFLDIHLEDGLSFSLLEENLIQCPVIFITAYDRYAIKAFKFNSIDYLLKPALKSDLEQALKKYSRQGITPITKKIISELKKSDSDQDFKERFTVKYGDRIRLVPTSEIGCFYSRAKGTFIYTESGKSYLLEQSLDYITTLINPKEFFKVNRKHIIRIDAIDSVLAFSNSRQRILLKTPLDEEIIVAREKVKEFKTWMES